MSFEVPLDARYHSLAPDVAAKYVELAGGSAADGESLAASLAHAIASLGAHGDIDLHLSFSANHGHVEVTVRGGNRTVTVRQPLPAPKT